MTEIAIGPFILATERLVWILATLALWGATATATASKAPRAELNAWAFHASIAGFIGARLGFVLGNLAAFRATPFDSIAFWQGGFSLWGGVVGFGAVSAWYIARRPALWRSCAMLTSLPLILVFVLHQLLQPPARILPADHGITALDASPLRLEGPAVINLWASWCPPCRREMPMMLEEAQANAALPIHFINQGESPQTIRSYLARAGLVMAPGLDPTMSLMGHFAILGLPATLFIDAQGRVIHSHHGEISRAALRAGMSELQR